MSAEVADRTRVRRRSSRGASRRSALDKKARDVVVLDMRDVVSYTDFLVICTGNTERQTKAIEDGIYQDLKHAEEAAHSPSASRAAPRPAGS